MLPAAPTVEPPLLPEKPPPPPALSPDPLLPPDAVESVSPLGSCALEQAMSNEASNAAWWMAARHAHSEARAEVSVVIAPFRGTPRRIDARRAVHEMGCSWVEDTNAGSTDVSAKPRFVVFLNVI